MEFLLLVVPMMSLASSTIGISWYALAKSQLAQIAAESALQAAQPDSSTSEVLDTIGEKLRNRLGVSSFKAWSENQGGTSSVSIDLPELTILGPLVLVLPGLSAVSDAPSEI